MRGSTRPRSSIPSIVVAGWIAVVVAQAADAPSATRLALAEPAFHDATAKVVEGAPTRFRVALQRDMPTPGYRFEVDGVEVDPQAGRISVRVTEVAPRTMTAQVITPTELAIPLGPLPPGTYVLEIRLRRGGQTDYRLAHAAVLSAF